MLDLAHIGERVRECRKKKMMTIRVLGEYTGLSAGYLSMLEQNKTSPNVDSLARICEALDIDIQYALEGEMPGKTVIHREEMSKHLYPEENMTVEVADFGQGESIFEYITIEPGESAKKEEYRHVFSEMCMVIKGTLNVEVEGKICSLHPGDSVYIKSRERHSISNPGKEPCVSIWVYHRDVPRRFERNENKIVK